MAANRKPRKAYIPKVKTNVGGLTAVARSRMSHNTLPAERQANVVIAYHTAIDAMTGGYAEKCHYDTIVYALNIGTILAQNGIGAEYLDLLRPASAAMLRCRQRWEKTGKFGLDGEGLLAVRAVADLHEAQIGVATHMELQAAIAEMHRMLAKGG